MRKLILPAVSLLVAIIIIIIKISSTAPITGAVTGLGDFEEVLTVSGESAQITQHIVFDENPPLFCEDGVYIEIDGTPVPFEIQNEVYEDGVCREVDVLITMPLVAGESVPAEILPENNSAENQTIGISNQTEVVIENQSVKDLNLTDETENNSQNPFGILTGMVVAEPFPEVKIYYGSAAETPRASIGRDVQISYKTDSSPELIVMNHDGGIFSKEVSKEELRELAKTARAIEKDEPVSVLLADATLLIKADAVWNKTVNGQNVTGAFSVCVIDTGVDYMHSDLGGCFGAGCKVIGGFDYINHDADPIDDSGHGTHVAGIIAADSGIKGVAPGANIVALKTLNSAGGGVLSDTISAIKWCTDNSTLYNITAISLSLGTSTLYTAYCDSAYPVSASAIGAAIAKNITVLIATGNAHNYTAVSSPACVKNATRVTSSDKSDNYVSFANRGAGFPDILVAPGVLINSTKLNGGYVIMNGTSMSVPFVAGLVALLQQHEVLNFNKVLTASQIFNAINDNGVSLNDVQSGMTWKRIDALAAVNSLMEAEFIEPPFSVTVQSPINGAFYKNNMIDFNITSNENLSVAFVSIDSGENIALLSDSALHYCNTSVLSEGIHNATFWANGTAGNSINATVFFTIDITNPLLFLNSPENNSVIHKNAINLSITDAYLSAVTYFTDANTTEIILANPYSIDTTYWPKGSIILTVTASDSAGNTNQSVFAFTVNNTKPVASSVSITPATATKTSDLTCAYIYSDADGDAEITLGANKTEFYWYKNHGILQNLTAATITSGNITKGEVWSCAVKLFDGCEYSAPTESADIIIQNSAPVVAVLYPKTAGERVLGTITVNATVTDADGQPDIDSVAFYFINSTGTSLIGSSSANISTRYEVSWNTSTTSDHNLTRIFVNATDSESAVSQTSDNYFVINNINEAPAITLTAPNGNQTLSGQEYVTWIASDPDLDSPLTISIYYGTNASWNLITSISSESGSSSKRWNTSTASNGANYKINITASDSSGLTASDASDSTFTINNTAASSTSGGSGSSGGSGAAATGGSLGGGLSAGTTYDIIQRFTAIGTATPARFTIAKDDNSLTEIIISVKTVTANAEVKVKKLAEKPADISAAPSNILYQYVQIDTANLSTLASATIKFKIPKTWVTENSVDSKKVSLKRWTGSWTSLTTTFEKEDSTFYYYIAITPGFSVFAVTGDKIETQAAAPASEGETPVSASSGFNKLSGKTLGIPNISISAKGTTILTLLVTVLVLAFVFMGLRNKSDMPKQQQRQQKPQYPPHYHQTYYYPPQQPPPIQRQQQPAPQHPPVYRQPYPQKQSIFKKPQQQQQSHSKEDNIPDFGF